MLFEKEKYYNLIKKLETTITITYIIIIIVFIILGALTKSLITTIILGAIGFGIANIYTTGTKIKVQEMKWKFDIYEKIMKKEA